MSKIDQKHIDAAAEEEERLLRIFMEGQQAQYLMNRCVDLNAQMRSDKAATESERPEGETG